MNVFVGCAGWSISSRHADRFGVGGSHLARYAAIFNAVEINSSFYRPHQAKTYARWARAVPAGFRFAVKVPKAITHELRLVGADEAVDRFVDPVRELGEKLGPLLVQLPPGLAFDAAKALPFFTRLGRCVSSPIVCEPRHSTWFEPVVERELKRCGISRVAADPAVVPSAAQPGGSPDVVYFRLHGSPRMYHSAYGEEQLDELVRRIHGLPRETGCAWCIFDNTAAGAATFNALGVRDRSIAGGLWRP